MTNVTGSANYVYGLKITVTFMISVLLMGVQGSILVGANYITFECRDIVSVPP